MSEAVTLPELHLADLRATKDTLHLYCQIVGMAFCQSAYEAGARLAGWGTTGFESTWCPAPSQLQQLRATAAADFGRLRDGSQLA